MQAASKQRDKNAAQSMSTGLFRNRNGSKILSKRGKVSRKGHLKYLER